MAEFTNVIIFPHKEKLMMETYVHHSTIQWNRRWSMSHFSDKWVQRNISCQLPKLAERPLVQKKSLLSTSLLSWEAVSLLGYFIMCGYIVYLWQGFWGTQPWMREMVPGIPGDLQSMRHSHRIKTDLVSEKALKWFNEHSYKGKAALAIST